MANREEADNKKEGADRWRNVLKFGDASMTTEMWYKPLCVCGGEGVSDIPMSVNVN